MQLSNKQKSAITQLLKDKRNNKVYKSDAQFARTIGMTSVDYSNIINEKWEMLSDQKWNKIALLVDYRLDNSQKWEVVKDTFVYTFVSTQLKLSKKTSLPTILIDRPGIGKSQTAECFCEETENSFYVRCSDAPTKSGLVAAIAQSMGLKTDKKTETLIQDIVKHANGVYKPILILDEAGFLKPTAWNIVHRIYNSCEYQLSLFLMGSIGLENEIKKGIKRNANGYGEVFSRLGEKYVNIFKDETERMINLRNDFEKVIKAQGIKSTSKIQKIISEANDLRRVRREIIKSQYI